MHGRLKVRTTEEQRLIKEKEELKKLAAYQQGQKLIFANRAADPYNKDSFDVSAQLLTHNPDIYTLWNYRREVLLREITACDKSDEEGLELLITLLENELKLTEYSLLANPKSYGSWHHRYWVLENHPKANWNREFSLCTKYLEMDDRNFHVWDYRRLVLTHVSTKPAEELKFSTDRLNANFSNYSSWHYRSTLRPLDASSIDEELALVQNAVFTDPADSSAWYYLRWVLSGKAVTDEHRQKLLQNLGELEEMEPECKWVYMAKCWASGSLTITTKENVASRLKCYKKLLELDPMRKGLYEHYINLAELK